MQKRVNNAMGQRPVENFVGSSVSLRYGGMQTASRSRVEMFGDDAPVWHFLDQFGGPADPLTGKWRPRGAFGAPPHDARPSERHVPTPEYTAEPPNYKPRRHTKFTTADSQPVSAALFTNLAAF